MTAMMTVRTMRNGDDQCSVKRNVRYVQRRIGANSASLQPRASLHRARPSSSSCSSCSSCSGSVRCIAITILIASHSAIVTDAIALHQRPPAPPAATAPPACLPACPHLPTRLPTCPPACLLGSAHASPTRLAGTLRGRQSGPGRPPPVLPHCGHAVLPAVLLQQQHGAARNARAPPTLLRAMSFEQFGRADAARDRAARPYYSWDDPPAPEPLPPAPLATYREAGTYALAVEPIAAALPEPEIEVPMFSYRLFDVAPRGTVRWARSALCPACAA